MLNRRQAIKSAAGALALGAGMSDAKAGDVAWPDGVVVSTRLDPTGSFGPEWKTIANNTNHAISIQSYRTNAVPRLSVAILPAGQTVTYFGVGEDCRVSYAGRAA